MKFKSYSTKCGRSCFAVLLLLIALGGCGSDPEDPASPDSTTSSPTSTTSTTTVSGGAGPTTTTTVSGGAGPTTSATTVSGGAGPTTTTTVSGDAGPTTTTTGSAGPTTSTTTTGIGTTGGSGGTSSSDGSGGSTTATGSSSTTGGAECGVEPVNPNATPQARNLLCYLYEVNGSGVLSGQQETSWNPNPNDDVDWYNSNFGVYPAVLGGDYLYPDGTTQRAIAYWNAGGIPMIRYHMGAPPMSDTYENSQGTANIANVLQPGTGESDSFYSKLDYISDELQQLEDANVAVLWAPFHEFQPNGWFWWSKGTDAQFHQLWQNMFDYLTETKGLDNLVWLAPSSGSPNGSWYPDKATYDVGGPDTYATDPPFASMYTQARGILGTSVPITLHETGTVVQPDTMFPSTAPWVLFNVWAGYYNDGQHNSTPAMQSAYASEYTITRDEVPDLKPATPREVELERMKRWRPVALATVVDHEGAAPTDAEPVGDSDARGELALMASLALAREGNARFPTTGAAPERARIVVKSLVGLRRFHEARDEARRMLAAYPGTPEALDVERHLLVYPLDKPSREQMQVEMRNDPAQ